MKLKRLIRFTTIIVCSLMLSACSNSVSGDDGAPMEESSQGYYSDAALIADEPGRCFVFTSDSRDCSFYAYIKNDGRVPLDFYAEAWAEDSEGRLYKCEGRGSIFEETLNPGMKIGNRFGLIIPHGVTIIKIYLVDISGPVSETILSAPVLLESSS